MVTVSQGNQTGLARRRSYRAPGHRTCSKCLGTMSLPLKGHKFRRQEVTTEDNEMDTKGKKRTGNMGIGRLGEQGRIKSTLERKGR